MIMNPNFSKIPFNRDCLNTCDFEEWKKKVEKETGKPFEFFASPYNGAD